MNIVVILFALSFALLMTVFIIVPGYMSPKTYYVNGPLGIPNMLRNQGKPIPVKTAAAVTEIIEWSVLADGKTSTRQSIDIAVPASSLIKKVFVDIGHNVQKGDLLIELDDYVAQETLEDAKAKLEQAEQNLEIAMSGERTEVVEKLELISQSAKEGMKNAKRRFEENKRLYKTGAIPKIDLDEAELTYIEKKIAYLSSLKDIDTSKSARQEDIDKYKASLESAKISYNVAFKDLKLTKIRAPMNGIVTYKNIFDGEVKESTSNKVLTISGELLFEAAVDQMYAGWLQYRQDAFVYLEAYPGSKWKGSVRHINQSLQTFLNSAGKPTFSVWIDLATDQDFLYGLPGYTDISAKRKALVIPFSALYHYSGGEGIVFVVEEKNKVKLRPVSYRITPDGRAEILSNLKAGETVVVTNVRALKDGDRIIEDNDEVP